MTRKATGAYQVTGWQENAYQEPRGAAKLTRASVQNTFSGDIEGTGSAEYLMAYPSDTSATFVGLQRVEGSVRGRKGTFVLQASGSYADNIARAEWSVVPDSGTGELAGLKGKGSYGSKADGSAEYELNFNVG
jgi:hypothetical protein